MNPLVNATKDARNYLRIKERQERAVAMDEIKRLNLKIIEIYV